MKQSEAPRKFEGELSREEVEEIRRLEATLAERLEKAIAIIKEKAQKGGKEIPEIDREQLELQISTIRELLKEHGFKGLLEKLALINTSTFGYVAVANLFFPEPTVSKVAAIGFGVAALLSLGYSFALSMSKRTETKEVRKRDDERS